MRLKSFLQGAKISVPVIFGFVPVAIAFAIMALSAGLNEIETILMSVFVFAGASQMMAVGMLGAGAGVISIVIATFIMNFRHFIMGTCVFERMGKTGLLSKLVCAFGVTDESFAIFSTTDREKCNKWYFGGIFAVTYLSWVVGTIIGAFANSVLPEAVSNSFGIALYAMFIGLLMPTVKKSARLLALVVVTALINLALRSFLEPSWALIASTLIGAGIGMFLVMDPEEATNE